MPYPSNSSALHQFVQRLCRHSALSETEQQVLLDLPTTTVHVAAHLDVVRLGQITDQSCLIAEGLVGRYGQTGDGKRQIVSLHLPGEMIDLPSVVMPQSVNALNALTATIVHKVPHKALRQAGFDYPAIAAAFWRDCVLDSGIVNQWLVNVGRRDARARTAHLLCELAVRLRGHREYAPRFPLALTQEQLADVLGLTPVHVNRVLRMLREERLATVVRGAAMVDDWSGLVAAGEFDARYLTPAQQSAA